MFPLRADALPSPHFVYNSLNLLQAFIQEGDKQGALSHLSRFSKLLRQWLRHAAEATVPLSAEVALLENYLALERDRFAASFNYVVVQEMSGGDGVIIKALVWHAAVAQALYGAELRSSRRGFLRITFTLERALPICVVRVETSAPDESSPTIVSEQKLQLIP